MYIRIWIYQKYSLNIYIHILPRHTSHQPPQPFVIGAQMEASESFRDCGNAGVTFSILDQAPWDDFQLKNGQRFGAILLGKLSKAGMKLPARLPTMSLVTIKEKNCQVGKNLWNRPNFMGQSSGDMFIPLMEEIPHHLGCVQLCK